MTSSSLIRPIKFINILPPRETSFRLAHKYMLHIINGNGTPRTSTWIDRILHMIAGRNTLMNF